MMRVILFLLTNFAVMFVFGIILSLLGVDAQSTTGLLIMALLFGFSGSFISLLLSKKMALRSVGGQIIQSPSNETEQWLLNIIQQQSQRVGIQMPDVAIYQAQDINAFATGARKNHSLVAVSSGLLESMKKDEAEAVLAHEISHIANGDMVTMTLLQGILNTFVIFISRILAQVIATAIANRNNSNSDSSTMSRGVYFIVAMILEFVFGILASIIAMWFSRHREFKADAGSAQIVGKDKMIAALERLKTSYEPQEESSIMAFCINGPRKKSFAELFMSHPPLDKRIEALRTEQYMSSNRSTLIK